ncbi:GEVED domain-containing protein [Flavobacterium sp.]
MKKITLLFLFAIGSFTSSFAQLTHDFEGTWPPTGWTIESTNPDFSWEEQPLGLVGKGASVAWNYAQDESLISPVFTVPAGSPSLKFKVSLSYFWSVNPNENYDAIVSISTDGGTTWTQIWDETVLGVFANFTAIDVEVPLTTYAGSTNAKIKFQYVGDDGADLYIDQISVDVPPAVVPDCATLTAPLNAATGIDYTAAVNLTWTAPAAGAVVDSYDVYLDTNTTPTTLLGNQTALTRAVTGLLPSTTYYWMAVPKNAAGPATGCTVFSFTTMANPFAPYCGPLAFGTDVEPITSVVFANINNVTSPTVDGTPAHENFTAITGNVTAGSAYTITLKGNTAGNFTNRFMVFADWNQDGDFSDADEAYTITATITNSTGVDAIQASQSIQVPPTALAGNTRLRVKKIFGTADYVNPCLGAGYGQAEDYTLAVAAAPTDSPDFVNLQFPLTLSVNQGSNGIVYGRVYEAGLTDTTSGQAPGIQAWVGYSTTNTNPNTWTNWIPATFNVEVGNDDEYQASIGATLAVGTYYYATRFQLNGGVFVYGGKNPTADGGNFWDGTSFVNGTLTVNVPPAPSNDVCSSPIALTPGGVFTDNDIDGTNISSTLSSETPAPGCGAFNFATAGKDVWYSVVVPASGSITIETGTNSAGSGIDTVCAVYSGACASLTAVGCDDDGATETALGLSKLSLTGQTPGDTLLIRVFGYNGASGVYSISAYDASLANGSFDNANFAYFPNPVTNILNLSYNKEISNVEIFNLLGQRVSNSSFNTNDAQVDMSNLADGAYMVKVTSDNQIKTIKVIKQ